MPLFSILITDDHSADLPERVSENIRSFKAAHPGEEHVLLGEAALAEFISAHFDAEVLSAFRALRPYAYKADLAKYCLLYEQGGVYADLSYDFLRGVPRHNERLSVFRDFLSSTPWDTSIGVVAAPPRHKALGKAIELVCANVRREYHAKRVRKVDAADTDPQPVVARWARGHRQAAFQRGDRQTVCCFRIEREQQLLANPVEHAHSASSAGNSCLGHPAEA